MNRYSSPFSDELIWPAIWHFGEVSALASAKAFHKRMGESETLR
jgi:hypothetical protein